MNDLPDIPPHRYVRCHSDGQDDGQLVLAGGIALAFAILLIAGLSQIGNEMEADRDIEPTLGPEFLHVRGQFEKSVIHRYNTTANESAEDAFSHCADQFVVMELQYGLMLDLSIHSVSGAPGNETIGYRMELVSTEQFLARNGTIELTR